MERCKKKKRFIKEEKEQRSGVIILLSTDERPEELIMSVEGGVIHIFVSFVHIYVAP